MPGGSGQPSVDKELIREKMKVTLHYENGKPTATIEEEDE